jgi:hypothetical protein
VIFLTPVSYHSTDDPFPVSGIQLVENLMPTMIKEQSHRLDYATRAQLKDWDGYLIGGFAIATIAVTIAVYALATASGIDEANLALMSAFP